MMIIRNSTTKGAKIVFQGHHVIDNLSQIVPSRQGLLEKRISASKEDVSIINLLSVRAVGPISKLVFLWKSIVDQVHFVIESDHDIVQLYIEVEVASRMQALHAVNHLYADLDCILYAESWS